MEESVCHHHQEAQWGIWWMLLIHQVFKNMTPANNGSIDGHCINKHTALHTLVTTLTKTLARWHVKKTPSSHLRGARTECLNVHAFLTRINQWYEAHWRHCSHCMQNVEHFLLHSQGLTTMRSRSFHLHQAFKTHLEQLMKTDLFIYLFYLNCQSSINIYEDWQFSKVGSVMLWADISQQIGVQQQKRTDLFIFLVFIFFCSVSTDLFRIVDVVQSNSCLNNVLLLFFRDKWMLFRFLRTEEEPHYNPHKVCSTCELKYFTIEQNRKLKKRKI